MPLSKGIFMSAEKVARKQKSIEQKVLHKLKTLPLDKKQEVLDFAEFLERKNSAKNQRASLRGLWSDLQINLTEEDINEARREMWNNFPREDF